MVVEVFDLNRYARAQLVEAFLCPVNRDMTRREHKCDDWGLYHNPSWLMEHFEANGGAMEFAKRRPEFTRVVHVLEEDYMI